MLCENAPQVGKYYDIGIHPFRFQGGQTFVFYSISGLLIEVRRSGGFLQKVWFFGQMRSLQLCNTIDPDLLRSRTEDKWMRVPENDI